MGPHDRRQQPRVEWTSEAVAAFGSREVRLRTRDLSVGGCCVETQLRPPTGERVGLVLHVDGDPVGTWAEVAWSMPVRNHQTSGYVWGLRFVELERDSAARLAAYVDHCFAVDMLDEMLRADSAPVQMPSAPAFTAADLEDVPTQIHRGPPVQRVQASAPDFFPLDAGHAEQSEATSEIDVESTLTSEVPHTHTVQVDMAELYRQMAQQTTLEPTATLAAGWDMGGPDPIVADAPAWSDADGWNVAPAWDAAPPRLEPDPFPAHAPVAWPSATEPAPTYTPQTYEENAFAKALPFDAPQHEQPQYYAPQVADPNAFDPSAFEPQALAGAPLEIALEPVPAPAPTITVELAPMTPADLLELKRKRIEAMLSSVPRRASAPESATKGNAAKPDVPTDKQKRPRTPTGPQPAGLRELFDEALREIGRDES